MIKKIINKILKVIQILVDLLMASMGLSLSILGMNTHQTYFYSDWYVYFIAVVIGIVIFNAMIEYTKRLVNDF